MPRRRARADKLDAKLKLELHWLQRGVTARRRRNQGRLAKLHEMRAQRAAMLGPPGAAKLAIANDDVRTKIGDRRRQASPRASGTAPIIKDFTLRIQRGDRIGIVGANGAGKTTLLKLLTGELAPDRARSTLAKTLTGVIIDQQRKLMEPDKTVRDVLADGGDWIDVRGHQEAHPGLSQGIPVRPGAGRRADRHACPAASARGCCWRANSPRRSNLLVLDEPTNDLDLETLDLLQEVIADYEGTVLIVSHDRDFLDRTVTVTLGPRRVGQGRYCRRRL